MYRFGLIGNCQISALINEDSSIDWLCLPRPDSEPIFGKLLDPEGGCFRIAPHSDNIKSCHQHYIPNTNILVTEIETKGDEIFRITDFCPRFYQFGRMYRPLSLFRIVEPIKGSAQINVKCHPVEGWSKSRADMIRGNSHLRYEIRGESLRLTTNMPMTFLTESTTFPLKEKLYFALTWGSGLQDDLVDVSEKFLKLTKVYWQTWVKHCTVPTLFQKETIRSALALKLHCYEDTGAILAALTTSLPEEVGHERNWDYRFCWLRDAYFVLSAFNSLGHFEEMEGFFNFLLSICHKIDSPESRLSPVYTLDLKLPLPEYRQEKWAGYKQSAPVRSNNQAAEHVQNDVYGEMILTLAPIFFDERFVHLRTKEHEELLMDLSKICSRTLSEPDAGLWEIRNGWQEHTFPNLLSWAGLERIRRIKSQGYLKNLDFNLDATIERAYKAVMKSFKDGALRNGPKDDTLDASLSLMAALKFPDTDLVKQTLNQIRKSLCADANSKAFFYRYMRSDDFGNPTSSFVICSFWISQALSIIGEREEALNILNGALNAANPLGLFSEHYHPERKLQLGNFPQAYSHVGLINAAFAVSPPWSTIL